MRYGFVRVFALAVAGLFLSAVTAVAQTVVYPDIGYVFPPGGRAGEAVQVRLGIYDFTPDTQFFVMDRRVKLEILGPPGRLLLAGSPYVSGEKAYRPLPLPREVPARFVLPADLPPGPVHWQIANANGASKTGVFIVGSGNEAVEDRRQSGPQLLERLPVTISGQITNNEEVDRYTFRTAKAGPVTCQLMARRLGSNLHGVLEVRDTEGRLVADVADTEGLDAALTFAARAGGRYTVAVHDLDFRGHRSSVYRLHINPGPRVLAAIPAAGRRGETRQVEFVGVGIATGAQALQSVTRTVTFPTDPDRTAFDYRLETPLGVAAPFSLLVGDVKTGVEPTQTGDGPHSLSVPAAITGTLSQRFQTDRYRWEAAKGQVWDISLMARRLGSPLDVTLAVIGPDEKQLAASDDLPGTTDARLAFTVPADGVYELHVGDMSGKSGSRAAVYHLVVDQPAGDFSLTVAQQRVNVLIGEKAELTVKAALRGGFNHPIKLTLDGLPDGVRVAPDTKLTMPPGSTQIKIPLVSAVDAASFASLVTLTGTAQIGDRTVTRTALAPGDTNLAPRSPEEKMVSSLLVVSAMKPRCRTWPVESDERTVHRGSTHLADIGFERLEGYQGEVLVQMTSKQHSKFRQGYTGPDTTLPPDQDRLLYPCFLPEGLETVDAYRMKLKAVVKVADPQGNERYLVSTFGGDVAIGITIEGALLSVSHQARELAIQPGETFVVPLLISQSAKLARTVRLELRVTDRLADVFTAESIVIEPDQRRVRFPITSAAGANLTGPLTLMIRATALIPTDELPEITESSRDSPMDRQTVSHLKANFLPVISETRIPIELLPAGER